MERHSQERTKKIWINLARERGCRQTTAEAASDPINYLRELCKIGLNNFMLRMRGHVFASFFRRDDLLLQSKCNGFRHIVASA